METTLQCECQEAAISNCICLTTIHRPVLNMSLICNTYDAISPEAKRLLGPADQNRHAFFGCMWKNMTRFHCKISRMFSTDMKDAIDTSPCFRTTCKLICIGIHRANNDLFRSVATIRQPQHISDRSLCEL